MKSVVLVSGILVSVLILGSAVDGAGPEEIDPFRTFQHKVSSGRVTLLDSRRIRIEGFRYDGGANNAYFWVGQGARPNRNGVQIPDEKGSYDVLRGYDKEDITLTLPAGMTFNDIDYLSVWCKRYVTNFGHVVIPKNLDLPEY